MIRRVPLVILLLTVCLFGADFDGAWLKKIPPQEKQKTNPYENQADAVASGRQVFLQHCSHCHGENAEGTRKHPTLISPRIQQEATPGDLHYLLMNGSMAKGMPPWSKLGDPQIWQLVSYLKSLAQAGKQSNADPAMPGNLVTTTNPRHPGHYRAETRSLKAW